MDKNLEGFKWYVFKKIGQNKKNDIKISEGFSRNWQARNTLKRLKEELSSQEKQKVELYVAREYVNN